MPAHKLVSIYPNMAVPLFSDPAIALLFSMPRSDYGKDLRDNGDPTTKKPVEFTNSGDSDVSPDGSPSQFLILRGLEPTATEELVAKGVSKLYKPGERDIVPTTKRGNAKVASTTGDANLGAREGSLRRILLVRDRRSNDSWRYGFAEFATVEVSSVPKGRTSSRTHRDRMPEML